MISYIIIVIESVTGRTSESRGNNYKQMILSQPGCNHGDLGDCRPGYAVISSIGSSETFYLCFCFMKAGNNKTQNVDLKMSLSRKKKNKK